MDTTIDPHTAQAAARLGLRLAGHMIPPGCEIVLTESVPGYEPATHVYAVRAAQLEPALAALLPWEQTLDGGAA